YLKINALANIAAVRIARGRRREEGGSGVSLGIHVQYGSISLVNRYPNRTMNNTILDEYQDTSRALACCRKVANHSVTVWNDHTKDIDSLVDRRKDTEALALLRERTPIRQPLIDRLDKLRIISQVSAFPHIDVNACTRRGILVCSDT